MGSPRVITDHTGAVKARRDFMPFGEEIYSGIGGRTGDTGQKYSATGDSVRQKFTGYQKDTETSLDFAEARMYENRFGRFTAVDPLLTSGKSANPQTFNRYVYVGNNPINITDPAGLDWYSKYNNETNRTDYQWYDNDPGDGWGAVSFSGHYQQLNNVCNGESCSGTVYLNRYGGYLSSERYALLAGIGTLGSFADTYNAGHAKGLANFAIGIINSPVDTGLIGYIPGTSAHDLFGVPRVIEPFEYSSTAEKVLGLGTQGTLLVGSLLVGGEGSAAGLGTKIKYIGRTDDLSNIPLNRTFLNDLPHMGSPRANYYQNMSVVRKAIRDGYSIRDASWFRPNSELAPTASRPNRTVGQTFLGAERLLLKNRGLLP